ncbi:MAG TPA: hypothetical protein PLN33_04580 [Hyphomonadaceae bacterium]|nr:hypothetical protein [Hyphomonadaceae bacterium]HPN05985.1 hypothetical protein [Hyphomonadaceae bacterium]
MRDLSELRLQSGRYISLREINQSLTYGGMSEGLPTVESNKQHLQRLIDSESSDGSRAVCLISPTETPIPWKEAEPYPYGTPARLPAITCVARFQSNAAARNPEMDFSDLIVIWLQDDFTSLASDGVFRSLSQIDWEKHARDLDF